VTPDSASGSWPPAPRPGRMRSPAVAISIAATAVVLQWVLVVTSIVIPALDDVGLNARQSRVGPRGLACDGSPLRHPGSVTIPEALSARLHASPSDGPVITRAAAEQLVRDVWPVRAEAIRRHDATAIRALESGAAAAYDLAGVRNRCWAGRVDPQVPDDLVALVPRQETYPAHFLAQASTTTNDEDHWVAILLFRRERASDPWNVTLATGYAYRPGVDPSIRPLEVDGFDVRSDTATMPEDIVDQLTDYFRMHKDTGQGALPPHVLPNAQTTGVEEYMRLHLQDQPNRNGYSSHFTFEPGAYGEPGTAFGIAAATADNEILCGAVGIDVSWYDPMGYPMFQDRDRFNWGPDVPPGLSDTIRQRRVVQLCVYAYGNGELELVGADGIRDSVLVEPGGQRVRA